MSKLITGIDASKAYYLNNYFDRCQNHAFKVIDRVLRYKLVWYNKYRGDKAIETFHEDFKWLKLSKPLRDMNKKQITLVPTNKFYKDLEEFAHPNNNKKTIA